MDRMEEKPENLAQKLVPHAAWRGIELLWDVVRATTMAAVVLLWQWVIHHWDVVTIVIVFVVCLGLLIWRDFSGRFPYRRPSVPPSDAASDLVPRADYEKALQASATHEGVRGELKQRLEKSEGDLELTIAEVHRRGSEIDRLTRDLEGCEKRFIRPKLNVSVLSYDVSEIQGPPALDLGITGLLGGRPTNRMMKK
jgi:hypothetical protein